MTGKLDTLIPKIGAIIDKYGKPMVFEEKTAGTYSPTTGSISGETTTDHTVVSSPPFDANKAYVAANIVQASNSRIFVPAVDVDGTALPFTLINGMKVTFDSKDYTVTHIASHYTGLSTGIYEIHVEA